MKRISKAMLIIVLALTMIFAVACNPTNGIESIEIEKEFMPIFSVGQEPDWSQGKLTIKYTDGTTDRIPLNSEGVEITGFDSSVSGTQTITVTYEGKSCQFTIEALERIQFTKDFERDYFVGEEFDDSTNVVITKDNGSTVNVALSDSKITIEGFNSSMAGTNQVTVTYKNGNEVYSTKVTVNIYNIDAGYPKLHEPTKKEYGTHESLDLTGGYLEIKGNDGQVTKSVPLSDPRVDVSGYRPEAAIGSQEAVSQVITVSYMGINNLSYNVTVTYSTVSYFKSIANQIAGSINWNDQNAAIGYSDGMAAINAVVVYDTLNDAEKTYITASERENVAWAAAMYGGFIYEACLTQLPIDYNGIPADAQGKYYFSDAFNMTATNYMGTVIVQYIPIGNSYEAVKHAVKALTADTSDSLILQVADAMDKLANNADLGGISFITPGWTSQTVKDAIGYLPTKQEYGENIIPQLQVMLDIYDATKNISDWAGKTDDASKLAALSGLIDVLDKTEITSTTSRLLFSIPSSWRKNAGAKDELWGMVFDYYYNNKTMDDTAKWEKITELANKFALPEELEDLYQYVALIGQEANYITNNYTTDTSYYQLYFRRAQKGLKEMLAGNNQMYKDILNKVLFQDLVQIQDPNDAENIIDKVTLMTALEAFRASEWGFYDLNYAMDGDKDFDELWDLYIDILEKRENLGEEYMNLPVTKAEDNSITLGDSTLTYSALLSGEQVPIQNLVGSNVKFIGKYLYDNTVQFYVDSEWNLYEAQYGSVAYIIDDEGRLQDQYGNTYYSEELSDEYKEDAKELWEKFITLTPSQMGGFFISMDIYYNLDKKTLTGLGLEERMIFDLRPDATNEFAFCDIIYNGYGCDFNEAEQDIFKNLLMAMESFAARSMGKGSADMYNTIPNLPNFYYRMTEASYAYAAAQDKQTFGEKCGDIYNNYVALLAAYSQHYTDTGEFKYFQTVDDLKNEANKALFEEFEDIIIKLDNLYFDIAEEENDTLYVLLFAYYERLSEVVAKIETAAADDEETYSLWHYGDMYYENGVVDGTNQLAYEDLYLLMYGSQYKYYLQAITVQDSGVWTPLYEVYESWGIKAFITKAAKLMCEYYEIYDQRLTEMSLQADEVKEIRESLATLIADDDHRAQFLNLVDVSGTQQISWYLPSLSYFYAQQVYKANNITTAEDQAIIRTFLNDLFNVEKAYTTYLAIPDDQTEAKANMRTSVEQLIDTLKESYNKITTDAWKTSVDGFVNDLYTKYTAEDLFPAKA